MIRKYPLCIILFLLCSSHALAQEHPQLQKAQTAIKSGDRANALAAYQELNKEGFEHADLHYNIGTLLFQEKKIGPAIYHLEKAYRTAPFDSTIDDNLKKARAARVENTLDSNQSTALWQQLLQAFPFHVGLLAWAIILGLGWLGLMGILFRKEPTAKAKTIGSTILIIGLFSTGLMSQRHDLDARRYAAITANNVSGQSAPSQNAESSFMAQEGAYGEILEAQSDYIRLRLQNGLEAWFQEKHLYFGNGEAP